MFEEICEPLGPSFPATIQKIPSGPEGVLTKDSLALTLGVALKDDPERLPQTWGVSAQPVLF